jgi:hypothetical protein
VRIEIQNELTEADGAERRGDLGAAWHHLERAHILSQPFGMPHVRVHLAMLGLGFRTGDAREVVGQLVRALVAAPGSWLGRFPLGNTGRARVGLTQPMPIPLDLQNLIDKMRAGRLG